MPEWWDVQHDGPRISVSIHSVEPRMFKAWERTSRGKFWTRKLDIGNEYDPPDCVDYLVETKTHELTVSLDLYKKGMDPGYRTQADGHRNVCVFLPMEISELGDVPPSNEGLVRSYQEIVRAACSFLREHREWVKQERKRRKASYSGYEEARAVIHEQRMSEGLTEATVEAWCEVLRSCTLTSLRKIARSQFALEKTLRSPRLVEICTELVGDHPDDYMECVWWLASFDEATRRRAAESVEEFRALLDRYEADFSELELFGVASTDELGRFGDDLGLSIASRREDLYLDG